MRAAAVLAPLDPFVELGAMRDVWSRHAVRVLTLASLDDALLAARITLSHLVVGLHRPSVVVTTGLCRSVPLPLFVDLAGEVPPWADAFGAPLMPLDDFLRAQGLDGVLRSGRRVFRLRASPVRGSRPPAQASRARGPK